MQICKNLYKFRNVKIKVIESDLMISAFWGDDEEEMFPFFNITFSTIDGGFLVVKYARSLCSFLDCLKPPFVVLDIIASASSSSSWTLLAAPAPRFPPSYIGSSSPLRAPVADTCTTPMDCTCCCCC